MGKVFNGLVLTTVGIAGLGAVVDGAARSINASNTANFTRMAAREQPNDDILRGEAFTETAQEVGGIGEMALGAGTLALLTRVGRKKEYAVEHTVKSASHSAGR